jgi:hypothetical protein
MLKKELELEERVNLLEKEVNLLGEDSEKTRLDLEEAVDSLRLEIESLKMLLKDFVPDFQDKFRNIRNTVLREIDPQWIAKNEPES